MGLTLKEHLTRNLVNIPGFRSNRKIVILESDDWGAIRMASKEVFEKFKALGIPVDKSAYDANDALESNDDLVALFEILTQVKDRNGNPAIITANNIVGNPDFNKIKQSNFEQYFFEPFTETLKRYPNHHRVIDLYKEGIAKNIFRPQFHGREHLNVNTWMKALQANDERFRLAFEHAMFSVRRENESNCHKQSLDAFGTHHTQELPALQSTISEGMDLFEKLWGYRSQTIISPCYIWRSEAEQYFFENGIQSIQSSVAQLSPKLNQKGYDIIRKYTGQKNKLGQFYTVRNAMFEPTSQPQKDWVDHCLSEISIAFRWKKPAIISTHRLNYIGSIHPDNRARNLKLLKQLLTSMLKKWPTIEFMSSDQFAALLKK